MNIEQFCEEGIDSDGWKRILNAVERLNYSQRMFLLEKLKSSLQAKEIGLNEGYYGQ